MTLVVQSHDELVAALPHVLGFRPEESVVVAPIRGRLPFARVDMPTDVAERRQMIDALAGPYARHASVGDLVAIVCVTESRRGADLASQGLVDEFAKIGVETPVRIWATDEHWLEFNSGQSGARTVAAESLLAAEAVGGSRAQPMQSRESLAESLVGDRAPVAATLPAAQAAAEQSTVAAERGWMLDRIVNFHGDGLRLSDVDSSRLLLALGDTRTRDEVWGTMTRENAHSHVALWTDMTRRAPDPVRAPAASMLGFASWLHGDGARHDVPLMRFRRGLRIRWPRLSPPHSRAACTPSSGRKLATPQAATTSTSRSCRVPTAIDQARISPEPAHSGPAPPAER